MKYQDLDSNVLKYQAETDFDKRDVFFELIWEDVQGLIYTKIPTHARITQQQDDFKQEAALALLECIARFNAKFKVKFSTYFMFYLKRAKQSYNQNGAHVIYSPLHAKQEDRPILLFPKPRISLGESGNGERTYLWDLQPTDYERDFKLLDMRSDFKKVSRRLKPHEMDVLLLMMAGYNQREVTKILEYNNWERVRQIYADAMDVCSGRERTSSKQKRIKNDARARKSSKRTKTNL
jgi:hypothetical protein